MSRVIGVFCTIFLMAFMFILGKAIGEREYRILLDDGQNFIIGKVFEGFVQELFRLVIGIVPELRQTRIANTSAVNQFLSGAVVHGVPSGLCDFPQFGNVEEIISLHRLYSIL